MTDKPQCYACLDSRVLGIYDFPPDAHATPRRAPACPAHGYGSPVVASADLGAVIASHAVCWCGLSKTGMLVVWCPTHGYYVRTIAPETELPARPAKP